MESRQRADFKKITSLFLPSRRDEEEPFNLQIKQSTGKLFSSSYHRRESNKFLFFRVFHKKEKKLPPPLAHPVVTTLRQKRKALT